MAVRMIVAAVCILAAGCTVQRSVKGTAKDAAAGVTYSGGTGESFQDAIIITGAKDKSAGVSAEYQYISDKHGMRGNGWLLVGQTVIREKNKIVDVIEIQLGDSSIDRRIYYFDVSDFLGKRR